MEKKDLKKKYSQEELNAIYSLGITFIENGELVKARAIFEGLIEVSKDFINGFLGMIYLEIDAGDFNSATQYCRKALELNPSSYETILFYISCLLTCGEYNKAGTYLGEVRDAIEDGIITDYNLKRFYKSQIVRYQSFGERKE